MAQVNRATITGIVSDPSGAVAVGVKVTATHVETGTKSSTDTTGAGAFTLPALQIGNYRIEFEAAGFKKAVRDQVTLAAGSTARLDIALELGSVGESVTVTAAASPIETESTRVATNITTKLVQDLPLLVNGGIRSVLTLAAIAPETRTAGGFRIGGGQGAGWEMMMDGMPLSSASSAYQTDRAPLSSVPIDAINEFTVETTGMKAEFGRAMGALTFETKSGANAIHGNLFENLRNNILDANGFFNNAENRARGVLKQHDFGGTVGAPVYIPKVYDGHNKTFFFASYQGFRNRAGNSNPQFLTIPTARNYEGDFSTWTRSGKFVQIYDPASTRLNPNGSGYIRDPFPGNVFSATRISAVAKRVIAVRPANFLPNIDSRTRGLADADVSNYVRAEGSSVNPWDKGSLRLDHQLNGSNRFSFLYLKGHSDDDFGPDGPTGLPYPFNGSAVQKRTNSSGRFAWDLARPHFLNTFRISSQKEKGVGTVVSTTADGEPGWNSKFQIANTPGPDRTFPQLTFTSYSGWGGAFWGGDAGGNVNLTDDVTLIRGNHNIKFGFFFTRDRWDGYGQHRANGSFGFSQQATSIPLDNSQNTGNAFASFLLGSASSWGLETPRLVRQIYKYYGGYIQDDWKITRKLTLNIGLRYEFTSPVQGGAFVGLSSWEDTSTGTLDGFTNFDPTVPNPGAGGRLGAAIFSGTGPGRTSGDLFDAYKWAFGPRLGLAYQANNKTVIRAYAGRSFAAVKTTGGSTHFQGFILNTTVSTTDQSVLDRFPIDNGLPAWNKPPFIDPTISNNQDTHFWQRSDAGRPPEYYTWNLDIQREIARSTVFTASYSGTKGTYLSSSLTRYNQIQYSNLTKYGRTLLNSPVTGAAAQAAGIAIPYAGFTSTVQRALSPYPQYLNINTNGGQPASVGERSGNSTYHAMTLKLDKRYSNGMTILASYVFSKQFTNAESAAIAGGGPLDHFNRQLEKALSNNDQTHMFRIAYSYDLPFGRGRLDFGRVTNAIVGDWTVSGYMSYESGTPTQVTHNYSPIGTGSRVFITSYEGWRAPISGEKFDPYKDVWLDINKFNQGISQTRLESEFGNATRNNPKLRSPWFLDESLGIARNIPIGERVKFSIRGEAFNVLNRVRWGGPSNAVTGANFGQIRTQGNTPRRMQLALRLNF